MGGSGLKKSPYTISMEIEELTPFVERDAKVNG